MIGREGRVAKLVLERFEQVVAGDPARLGALREELARLLLEPDTRVLVIELIGGEPALPATPAAMELSEFLAVIDYLPQAIVCVASGTIGGPAVALVAASDLALAVEPASFRMPAVRLGRMDAVTAPYLIRALGFRTARRLMLTAEPIDAATAGRLGLVDEVVTADRLRPRLDAAIASLLLAAPGALVRAKRMLDYAAAHPEGGSLHAGTLVQADLAQAGSAEAEEGRAAAQEGRPPSWA